MEFSAKKTNGFIGLLLFFGLVGGGVYFLIQQQLLIAIPLFVIAFVIVTSITIVQPNDSLAVTFFGKYIGTVRESGFWMVMPFSVRKKVSLKVRNFNSIKLKVNDVEGNPIEIAAVIVFKVVDTAKALFDVDKYEQFVEIQSETALRHVASKYPYDNFSEVGYSLRGNAEEVSRELASELQERLAIAGVEVIEARLTHLAYSMEIAGAMLQRQQAAAILSARQKIVEGAVSIVTMAIDQIEKEGGFVLDPERKTAMVNNLLVTIVSERGATPVVHTGQDR